VRNWREIEPPHGAVDGIGGEKTSEDEQESHTGNRCPL
jgi:hypothetical protein